MTFTHALSTNNYGPCRLIVATSAANGTHTTLASAMAAASVGDTIFLRDSVTENVTITPGVNIAAWTGGTINTPSITGKLTMTGAGTSTISGLALITNSDFAIAVTGSAASILYINDCYLNCLNNTGLSFTSSSASSRVSFTKTFGNLATTGIGIFSGSTAGLLSFDYSAFTNTGNSTTSNTCASTGTYVFNYTDFSNPLTTSATAIVNGLYTVILTSTINTTSFTHNSTVGAGAAFRNSTFIAGTASAVVVGAGALALLVNTLVESSNASTISNSGTLNYSLIQSGASTDLTLAGGGTYNKFPTQPQILKAVAWSVTRDLTTATGTQTVSGLGITPVMILNIATGILTTGATFYSFCGQSDASVQVCSSVIVGSTAFGQTTFAGVVGTTGAAYQTFTCGSFTSGQFVLSWTKTSVPTGTGTVSGIAFGY